MPDSDDKKIEISYVPDDSNYKAIDHTDKISDKKHLKSKNPALKKLQLKIKTQEKILKKIVEERDELHDKYLRNLAEVDNYRKRVQKEKDEFQKYILFDFLKELLEIFDNLERALNAKNSKNHEKSIISGVEMIYKQFTDLLKKYKVSEIEALNKPFDPNYHQALTKVESDSVSFPTIIEVYQKGFLYNNKLLRPSLTKVSIPKEAKSVSNKKKSIKNG